MPGLHSSIYNFLQLAVGPAVIDGRLNPFRLALARWCYWIQSQIFHIPDCFAIISAGPPRLQVHECGMLLVKLVVFAHMVSLGGWALLTISMMPGKPVGKYATVICLMLLSCVIHGWIAQVMSLRRYRTPGYIWEDWKERVE